MVVDKGLLMSVKGSLLCDMFSGDIKNLNKDTTGKIYLNRNPLIFGHLLDYLRTNG